jgi:hypothetical protein
MSVPETPEPVRTGWRADVVWAVACGAIAAGLAVVPHLAQWYHHGTPRYIASGDDVIYLAVARPAYYGEGRLRDPFATPSQNVPTAFSWTQFVPFTAPVRWAGVPFLLVPLVWRAVGGLMLGAAAYLLARRLAPPGPAAVGWAVGMALVWIADAGTVHGRPLAETGRLVVNAVRGMPPHPAADGFGQFRVVSPLLSFPWMLLVAAGFAASGRSVAAAVRTGVALGVCVLMYFFLWTALVGACGMYLLLHLARWARGAGVGAAREVRFAALVLGIGLAVGGAQIISNALTFADPGYREALDRTSLGYHVPPGDPVRYQYIRSFWVIGFLGLGVAAAIRWRSTGLGFLSLLCLSGYLLRNSAIVTGLEFENYHWSYAQNAAGEWIVLAVLAGGLARAGYRGAWRALVTVGIILVVFAAAWRWYESQSAQEPVWYNRVARDLEALAGPLAGLSPEVSLAGPRETNVAILFGRCGQLYMSPHTAHRSLIPDAQVHERHAANAWVCGLREEEYAGVAEGGHSFSMTHSSRPEWQPAAVRAVRLALFRKLAAGEPVLDRFRPVAVLLGTGTGPPRGGRWRVAGTTDRWVLWVPDDE